MLALPWGEERKPKTDELLEEEVKRLLAQMKGSKPGEEAYEVAYSRYKELNEQRLKAEQLKESRRGRWFDALVTGALAGITLTAESWTPLTSRWANGLMRPFRSRRDKIDF